MLIPVGARIKAVLTQQIARQQQANLALNPSGVSFWYTVCVTLKFLIVAVPGSSGVLVDAVDCVLDDAWADGSIFFLM